VATCTAERVAAEVRHGDRVVTSVEGAWQEPTALAAQLRALTEAASLPAAGCALSVFIQRPDAQVRRLTQLPPVAARHLEALLRAQAARTFRQNGVPLLTAARWVPGTPRVAEVAAVPAVLLDQLAAAADLAGLTLTSITAMEAPALGFVPPATQRAQRRRLRRATTRSALAALALWTLAGAVSTGRVWREQARVRAALEARAAPAAALARLRAEWTGAQAMLAAVAATEAQQRVLLHQLTRLAAALPDSAFLASLTLSATGATTATGYARRATDVAAALERQPGLPPPTLGAALGREALGGREWDRFRLTLGDTLPASPAGGSHGR